MKFAKTPIALAAFAVCTALPAAAQTTSTTIEAESMALSSYAVEGNRIKLTATTGTASKTFSGASGTYNMQVYVVLENDGQSTLEVYNGATQLQKYTYPLGSNTVNFSINNVALNSGDTLRLLGRKGGGGIARVDKIVLTRLATSATPTTEPVTTTPTSPTAMTIEAEGMTRSSYDLDGSRIKVSSSNVTGTAMQSFSGASGTYNMQVHVLPETDGQSKLEVYKGSTLLQQYTYPLSGTATSFTISNVALSAGETIKLVGRPDGGAYARVDKIVLSPVSTSSTPTTQPVSTTPTTQPVSTTPTTQPVSTTPTTRSVSTTPIIGDALASVSPVTMEAEGMALASYAVENGKLIKLTASSGTATKNFNGAKGTYKLQVYVQPENDGQSTLEIYKGATLLKKYTYPLSKTATSFAIDNVALNSGEPIKLLGRKGGGGIARVDKVVFTPMTSSTTPSTAPVVTTPDTNTGTACANPSGGYEGFGRNTTGGAGKPIYRVTNLNDSGTGSLRDALSQGDRCVVFDVGGTISLSSNLLVRGANVTIDGLTAPSPGITLKNRTLLMQASNGASNIVLRGIRHRGAPLGEDAIRLYGGASNVVIDRVSVSGFGDGAIDVTESARDVTIQWSILGNGNPDHNAVSLIKYNASRVTVHHNLYINGDDRNPHCGHSDSATSSAPEIVCDVRNNLIWNYRWYGTAIRTYATANVVNNYYYTAQSSNPDNTIFRKDGGSAYVSGNHSKNGWNVNVSNRSTPYASIEPTTTDAITAAHQVLAHAGARGPNFSLDAADQGYIGQVSIQ